MAVKDATRKSQSVSRARYGCVLCVDDTLDLISGSLVLNLVILLLLPCVELRNSPWIPQLYELPNLDILKEAK